MTRFFDPSRPAALLSQCPAYAPTPLDCRDGVLMKHESMRMGLGAFKALGGVYAVARLLMGQGDDTAALTSGTLGQGQTFICASAGNHGMAVASGARLFGAAARIHLAETVDEGFVTRLRAKGAQVVRSGPSYETALAAAEADADATGGIYLADGSWPGYTEPPRLVMEGYTIMAREMATQLDKLGVWPDAIFLQGGVGGLAAAIAETVRHDWPHQPRLIVVEPDRAPCLKASAEAGSLVTVTGAESNMGRLDCKDASMLALEVLMRAGAEFITITEDEALDAVVAAKEMGVESTTSGLAGFAGYRKIGADRPLIIVSEGAG